MQIIRLISLCLAILITGCISGSNRGPEISYDVGSDPQTPANVRFLERLLKIERSEAENILADIAKKYNRLHSGTGIRSARLDFLATRPNAIHVVLARSDKEYGYSHPVEIRLRSGKWEVESVGYWKR